MTVRFRRLAFLFAGGALLLALPHRADAEEVLRYCFNQWPPYSMMRQGEATGISVEILTEATRRAGLRAQFTELPWNRCLDQVRQGQIDAVVDAAARPEFLQGSTSVSYYSNTIWVRDTDGLRNYAPALLKGRKVGLVHGYEYPPSLLKELDDAGAEFDRSVDDPTNIRKLAFGRIDAIVADLASTIVFVRKHGLSLRPLRPTHSADPLYPSFNPKAAARQVRIDKALAETLQDGTVDRIYRRYLDLDFCSIAPPGSHAACQSQPRQ